MSSYGLRLVGQALYVGANIALIYVLLALLFGVTDPLPAILAILVVQVAYLRTRTEGDE